MADGSYLSARVRVRGIPSESNRTELQKASTAQRGTPCGFLTGTEWIYFLPPTARHAAPSSSLSHYSPSAAYDLHVAWKRMT
jgi:hypothetical protein